MKGRALLALFALAAGGVCAIGAAPAHAAAPASYQDLVKLFQEWREFQKPAIVAGVPDYTAAAMAKQKQALPAFQKRLAAIDPAGWPVAQQVDYRLVRAEMNGLDFDHRVLRPWSRNPCFYAVIVPDESDTPAKEGPAFAGALPTFRYKIPLSDADAATFRTQLKAIPKILDQAKGNLTEDARDLWILGIRVQKSQAALLADLGKRLAPHHPDLAADAEKGRQAVESFRGWLEERAPSKKGPSGVGEKNYDWYMKNVHLSPYTWRDEVTLMRREHARATAQWKLEEHRNRALPPLEPIASAADWDRRFGEAVTAYVKFLNDKEILTVTPDADPALRARGGSYAPPDERDFFAQIDFRDPLVMRTHGKHWLDLARMRRDPHPSPIRRGALLYNIWDSRAEGLATAMEEMMMTAGLFDQRPRSRELVYILVANRAARGLAGLLMHGGELSLGQAVRFAHEGTPNGWLKADGELVWGEQQNYLEQPGYGTCYLTGKAQIERLMADRSKQLGEKFTVKKFMDDLDASGMIPVSLIRWEMTGQDDEVRALAR